MLNNILLSQTIGNCSERRNKTRAKGIGIYERGSKAGERIINLNNEYVSNDEKGIFKTAFLQILVIYSSRSHSSNGCSCN